MTTGPPPNIIVPISDISDSVQNAECKVVGYRLGKDWQTNRNLSVYSPVHRAKP